MKPGRNDPCPCGSGKKYKHCHLRLDEAAAAAPAPDEGAVGRALGWLQQYHRKAFAAALDDLLWDLWPDDDDACEPEDLSPEVREVLHLNLTEWQLAGGQMQVHGKWVDVPELLLGPGGPPLTPAQREWLQALAREPLRLYTVTAVRPGESVTLADALDTDAPPRVVGERTASRTMQPGLLVGARLLPMDGGWQLSGALYPFSPLREGEAIAAARAEMAEDWHPQDVPLMLGYCIVEQWLCQYALPARLPPLVDALTGEPLQLVTDHYRVVDEAALAAALAASPDVTGDAASGWRREAGGDGPTRSLAAIGQTKGGRLEVFYRTQRLADEGRAWFEAVAGEAVQHLAREVVDPTSEKALEAALDAEAAEDEGGAKLSPEALGEAVAEVLQRTYANWADEPIPALGDRTPRQAAATPAGLERVKGLLRSYAAREVSQAAAQGRTPISYDFLWRQLGLEPEAEGGG